MTNLPTNIDKILGGDYKTREMRVYTEEQKQPVAYFFMRLKNVYPTEFLRLMPDERTLSILKREYAPQIIDFTKQAIDKGFDQLHSIREISPDDWTFLDIDKVIGLVRYGGNFGDHVKPAGIHKVFEPERLLTDKTAQEKAHKAGEAALSAMRNLF